VAEASHAINVEQPERIQARVDAFHDDVDRYRRAGCPRR
jgi:hypothetical protein